MRSKYFLFIVIFIPFSTLLTKTSFAQLTSQVSAVPLPVGSGARALGMGGAFIAVADDATAASWNPGGLTQLERPELSVVGSFLSTQQDFDPPDRLGFASEFTLDNESVSRGDLNYASIAYPFEVFRKNLVASLNYQQKYDFHLDVDYNFKNETPILSENHATDFELKGGIGALTPTIAMQILPKLSIGVAVNIYTDEFFGDFAWKEKIHEFRSGTSGITPFSNTSDTDVTFKNFQAVNVTAGILWDVWEKENKRLTFGAVFHSPYTADVDRVTNFRDIFVTSSQIVESQFHERMHLEIDYPMSFGAGLGFRYSDSLSFSMDATWTDWSEFKQKDEFGNELRPLGFVSAKRDIDDTYAVRFGTEYLLFRQKMIIPIRGGLFYDPRPSLDEPTHVYGFSAGSGITFKRVSIDGAYQFRWANDVDGADFGLPGTFDLNEHLFLASVIVYF
ncbi:MAG: hypothetical protein JETT_1417 [Candidatus Jettenia ecosi]|uniref:Long-chain fatty acid transport protein n=1 Tax=Candidatus Jettenia ecosi TaxID=2494326 RepID=A0A533QCA7_9BACT|nr:MAG: hypothetical protein JETT_1417 [Candidatus Jettenia ecosi]